MHHTFKVLKNFLSQSYSHTEFTNTFTVSASQKYLLLFYNVLFVVLSGRFLQFYFLRAPFLLYRILLLFINLIFVTNFFSFLNVSFSMSEVYFLLVVFYLHWLLSYEETLFYLSDKTWLSIFKSRRLKWTGGLETEHVGRR